MVQIPAGVAFVVAPAMIAASFFGAALFGGPVRDPIVTLTIVTTALIAALLPAWRTTRADPVSTLRESRN